MKEEDFEGTLVLEKLARIDKLEDFFEAIDYDDAQRAETLMRKAGLDEETIALVLRKMADLDDRH